MHAHRGRSNFLPAAKNKAPCVAPQTLSNDVVGPASFKIRLHLRGSMTKRDVVDPHSYPGSENRPALMLRGRLKTRTSRAANPASAPAIAKQGPRFQKRSQASQRHMAPSGCALLLAASIAFSSRTRAGLRRAPPQDAQALRFHSALLISIFAAPSCFWRMSVILGGSPSLRPFEGCAHRRRRAA